MIHYVAYYSLKNSDRISNVAGEDKIDYICDSLQELGYDITVVSNCKSFGHKYNPTEKIHLNDGKKLIMFSSLPNYNIITKILDTLWGYLQLLNYIIGNVKHNDIVLVYHSLGYRGFFKFARKIKHFKYILEVEELFQFIEASNSSYKKNEDNVFSEPDAFIFSNKQLDNKINIKKLPSLIINGVYRNEKRINHNIFKRKDKIRIVYAGSLEKQKGVDYIVNTAPLLSNSYEIRIIGFGSNSDVDRIKKLISLVSQQSKCSIYFDGKLKGKEYFDYIQSCDIGVCFQDENDQFNQFEFPSKVLSYLSNGLCVITNDLIQIRESDVFSYIYLSKTTSPVDIFNTISVIKNFDKQSNEIKLDILDKKFKKDLKYLLNRI